MSKMTKKFLSTVLVLSLLAGFSASVASFATMPLPTFLGKHDFILENYIAGIVDGDYNTLAVFNDVVRRVNEIEETPMVLTNDFVCYTVTYDDDINGLIINNMGVVEKCEIVYVPDTLFGMPVLGFSDHMKATFLWKKFGSVKELNIKVFCVPERLKEQMKEQIKKNPALNGINVISYDEAKGLTDS